MQRRPDSARDNDLNTDRPSSSADVKTMERKKPPPESNGLKFGIDDLPPALQPAAVYLQGFIRALLPLLAAIWYAVTKLGGFVAYVAIWLSPLLVWIATKYITWYVTSYVKKLERVADWVVWVVNMLDRVGGYGQKGNPA